MKTKALFNIVFFIAVIISIIYIPSAMFQQSFTPFRFNRGHWVYDSTYYSGKYYKVSDDIIIILEKGLKKDWDECFVYEKTDSVFHKTSANTFPSIHDNEFGMLWYLKREYKEYLNEKNKKSVW